MRKIKRCAGSHIGYSRRHPVVWRAVPVFGPRRCFTEVEVFSWRRKHNVREPDRVARWMSVRPFDARSLRCSETVFFPRLGAGASHPLRDGDWLTDSVCKTCWEVRWTSRIIVPESISFIRGWRGLKGRISCPTIESFYVVYLDADWKMS